MSDEMRILTVRQPWAWAIVHGGKDVENRVRNLAGDYRGPIAIHAGLAKFEQHNLASRTHAALHGGQIETRIIYGAIIGVVDLDGVHQGTVTHGPHSQQVASCFRAGKPFGLCSPWAEHDAWHLELTNPRPLRNAIPWKGALGLQRLPANVIEQITDALR